MAPKAGEIVEFWFGVLDGDGVPPGDRQSSWWKRDPEFDQRIEEHFGELVQAAHDGALREWEETASGTLALILLLDQFSRNIYRGSRKMYEGDGRALALCESLIESGRARELPVAHLAFAYMPLMHSEDLERQERCVALFATLAAETEGRLGKLLAGSHKAAVSHRDIVARFGRFPHRNRILDRTCNAEELEFLQEPGSSF